MRSRLALLLAVATALVTGAGVAEAQVSVGHSGWFWGNPRPQGNYLYALEFAGGRGYAAGQFGTLLRSDDAGATWRGISTGITLDLRRVRLIGPETVIVGGGCSLRRSDNGGQSFTRLPFTPSELTCPALLSSFHFPSATLGYLVLQDGTLLRTEDGGKTFARRTAVPDVTGSGPESPPVDIQFTSADTGFAVTRQGRIYRTTDGGGSWALLVSTNTQFFGVYFASATVGYAVGDANTLYRTTDGGATWERRPLTGPGGPFQLRSISCAGPDVCLIATGPPPNVSASTPLLRTTDGGETAAAISPSTQAIYAAAFASASRAVAVGQTGTTVVSDDAGANFAAIGGRVTGRYGVLRATSSTVAYAGGNDGLLTKTTDGGRSWTSLGVPTSETVADVSFPTADTGFAVDSSGALFRTDNAAGSWKLLNTGTSVVSRAILALDTRTILLVGFRGVRRSTDGGDSFQPVTARTVARADLHEVDVAGSAIVVHGRRALLVSRDRGRTWAPVRPPNRRKIVAVDFVSATTGYLLDQDGKLWVRSRGEWTQRVSTGTLSGYDLAFSDARTGYLATSRFGGLFGGLLLRTTDAGRSWRPQLVSHSPVLRARGLATAGSTDYAMTDALFDRTAPTTPMFATTSGGDAGAESVLTLARSRLTLRRPGVVRVSGRLRPVEGGEQVVVSMRQQDARTTVQQVAQVAANGTFTTTWRVRRFTIFVAQWRGDDDSRGDGSLPLEVSIKRR